MRPDHAPNRSAAARCALRHAAADLGTALDALLYVGDSEVDAATALAAQVPFALHTEGYRKSPVAEIRHQARFAHYDELASVVAALASGETRPVTAGPAEDERPLRGGV